MDFGRLAGLGGLEMNVDRAGLVEGPDLAEIGDGCGIGGIELTVARRDLEPIPYLKRAEPSFVRRRVGGHDENVGVESRIGGKKVLLRGRADSARPEKRLVSRVKRSTSAAILGAAFGAVSDGIEDVDAQAGPKLKTLALLP